MSAHAWRGTLPDEAATRAFGEALGRHLQRGEAIALVGPLGAGKTTLTQGIAKGLDVPPHVVVRSPSFALCNEVEGRHRLLHYDLYRLSTEEEAEEIGFREHVGSEGVAVVEWADRWPELMPDGAIWIVLEHAEVGRRCAFLPGGSGIDPRALPGGTQWQSDDTIVPWESSSWWS